MEKENFMIVN